MQSSKSYQFLSLSRNSLHFMEPQGLLPPHKSPTVVPILSQFNPFQVPPSYWRSVLILSSYLSLYLPRGLFPSNFPTKTLYTPLLSRPPHMLHTPTISFLSYFLTQITIFRCTNHEACHYVRSQLNAIMSRSLVLLWGGWDFLLELSQDCGWIDEYGQLVAWFLTHSLPAI